MGAVSPRIPKPVETAPTPGVTRDTSQLETDNNHEFMERDAWEAVGYWKRMTPRFTAWRGRAAAAHNYAPQAGVLAGVGFSATLWFGRTKSPAILMLGGPAGLLGREAGLWIQPMLRETHDFLERSEKKSATNHRRCADFYKDVVRAEVYLAQMVEMSRRERELPQRLDITTGNMDA